MARRYKPLPAGTLIWWRPDGWHTQRGFVVSDLGLHSARLGVQVLADDGSGRPVAEQLQDGRAPYLVRRQDLAMRDPAEAAAAADARRQEAAQWIASRVAARAAADPATEAQHGAQV